MALRWNRSRRVKALAYRVPFSRFHKVARWLLWGEEVIDWRGVEVKVNPGLLLEYYAYFFGDYATAEIDKLIELCRHTRLFIDVGANAGLFSLAGAHACPTVSVVGFEPDRDMAARLRRNLARNGHLAERVRLVEKAVGDVDGSARFLPSTHPENPGLGRLAGCSEDGRGYEVPVVRLDSFLEGGGRPDVVKIDVEGGELRVLRGMAGLFAMGRPRAILVETHGFCFGAGAAAFTSDVVRELERAGFSVSYLRGWAWPALSDPSELSAHCHLLGVRAPR